MFIFTENISVDHVDRKYRVDYFGDDKVCVHEMDNSGLELFNSFPQIGTKPDRSTPYWRRSLIDIEFLSRLNRQDRLWIRRNFDSNMVYSLEWVEDETQDEFNIEQRLNLYAFSQARALKLPNVPIKPREYIERANSEAERAMVATTQALRMSENYEKFLVMNRNNVLLEREQLTKENEEFKLWRWRNRVQSDDE